MSSCLWSTEWQWKYGEIILQTLTLQFCLIYYYYRHWLIKGLWSNDQLELSIWVQFWKANGKGFQMSTKTTLIQVTIPENQVLLLKDMLVKLDAVSNSNICTQVKCCVSNNRFCRDTINIDDIMEEKERETHEGAGALINHEDYYVSETDTLHFWWWHYRTPAWVKWQHQWKAGGHAKSSSGDDRGPRGRQCHCHWPWRQRCQCWHQYDKYEVARKSNHQEVICD